MSPESGLPRRAGRIQIRAVHPYAFRSGQWADLKGTALLPVQDGEPDRACYLVEFPDLVADFWPVENSGCGYEFRKRCEHA